MKINLIRKLVSISLSAVIALTFVISALPVTAEDLVKKSVTDVSRLVVNTLEQQGDIMHGASGFLYGISSEGVPENSLIIPLKPKVLATKGALGTEHPYGDALDVAESFFISGGEMVQMYCSNYYAIFGPVATNVQYAKDLKEIIAPAVVKWKNEWKDKHGTPQAPKDELGKIDIDKAMVYLPINEGSPQVDAQTGNSDNYQSFYQSWKLYYDAIKEADPKATVGGPNDALYGHWRPGGMEEFLEFCAENDCWPDVQTWHQLDDGEDAFARYPDEIADYRRIAKKLKMPESPIVINEYATMEGCGVPGILIRYIANMEENKVYACLPFWHQANNLNDLAADANEPNSAWWFYKWYADMSGKLLSVSKEKTTAVGLSGIASIDSGRSELRMLFGGTSGEAVIVLKDLAKADGFKGAKKVNVKLQAAHFKGFLGTAEPQTLTDGVYELDEGHLILEVDEMISSSGYSLIVTPAEDDAEAIVFTSEYVKLYEAENAELMGSANVSGSGGYYASGRAFVSGFSKQSGVSFKIKVPADGNYMLELVYGNGKGTDRGNEEKHSPQNAFAELSIDSESSTIVLKNTMLREWSGIYSECVDLTAGDHTLTLFGASDEVDHSIMLDALYVTYNGAYSQGNPAYNVLFEAEDAEFNCLADVGKTAVSIESKEIGFTGRGYITGLEKNSVVNGGGIRLAVNVPESGLYKFDLRYRGKSSTVGVYVGNGVRTFDGVKSEISLKESDSWSNAVSAIYLQKGMNIVDVDSSSGIMLDSLRISELPGGDAYLTTIEAVDAVPAGADWDDVSYYVWKAKADGNGEPELFKEYKSTPKTAVTHIPEEIEYVVGRSLSGGSDASEDVNKYLEFTYNAEEAGVYALRIFHSNDEIFGTHGYNTKIIDKYLSVQVNGGEAKRYFFINTLSKDTFKEKTVYITLKKGENKIKLFNDDSWSVLKGLDDYYAEQAGLKKSLIGDTLYGYYMDKPGDIPITNAMPNLWKFIISPSQVSVSETIAEHDVTVKYTNGGMAFADRNSVKDGESVAFTIMAKSKVEKAVFNGEEVSLAGGDSGIYTFTANNVTSDCEFAVVFEQPGFATENSDTIISNNSFESGNTDGWNIDAKGKVSVESSYFDRYLSKNYLRISGKRGKTSVSQSVTVEKAGVYCLSFAMKNKGYDDSEMSRIDEIKLVACVDGKKNAEVFIVPCEDYSIVSCLINAERGGAVVDFSVDIKAKGKFSLYLDDFTLTECDINRDALVYLVDCGDHNPKTRPKGGKLGGSNSITDMLFDKDPKTGKQWGAVDYLDPDGTDFSYNGDSNGAFSMWTRPYTGNGTEDTQDRNETFRYACNQDGSNQVLSEIGEVFVDYKFELEPNQSYDVEIGLGNVWGNSSGVNVYANYLSDAQLERSGKSQSAAFSVIEENVFVPMGDHTVVTGTVSADVDGFLTICLRRPLPAENTTINLNYIIIRRGRTTAEYKESISKLAGEIAKLDRSTISKSTVLLLDKSKEFTDEILAADIQGNDIVVLSNAEISLKNLIAAAELDTGDESINWLWIVLIVLAVVLAAAAVVVLGKAVFKKKRNN